MQRTDRTRPKVSVIVPTYNTGAGLDGLVASLDAQSLPDDEYELVVVDDGSTDDTFERLQALANARTNVHVDRIANTGWPGRARNLATDRARGEYVLYLDHDDRLFPGSLERMYDYASRNDADLLLAKEVKTRRNTPGWLTFGRNEPRVAQVDQHVLQGMTPHKLYRLAFLRDHDIRFPEGAVRLEDHRFNAQVFAQTDAIAILADYPCYQWVIHDSNSNRTKADPQVYWQSFTGVIDDVERLCADPVKRQQMLARWYKYIVLDRLVPRQSRLKDLIKAQADEIQNRFDSSIDVLLAPSDRLRSALYRRRDHAAIDRLSRLERGMRLAFDALEPADVEWSGGALRVRARGVLALASGRPYPLTRRDGRVVRLLPGVEPEQPPPAAAVDLTGAVRSARVECTVRGRTSGVEWPVTGHGRLEVIDRDGTPAPVFTVAGSIDPATAAMGRPLSDETWDVIVRVAAFGHTRLAKFPTPGLTDLPAIVDGRPVVAFRADEGTLALDLGMRARTIVGAARPRGADAVVDQESDVPARARLTVPLPRVHVRGSERLEGSIVVRTRLPATIVADDAGARLEFAADLVPGRFDARAEFDGRVSARPMTLIADVDGNVRLETIDDD